MNLNAAIFILYLLAGFPLFLLGIEILRDRSGSRLQILYGFFLLCAGLELLTAALELNLVAESLIGWRRSFLGRLGEVSEFIYPLFFLLFTPLSRPRRTIFLILLPHTLRLLLILTLSDVNTATALPFESVPSFLKPLSLMLIALLGFIRFFTQHHQLLFAAVNLLFLFMALSSSRPGRDGLLRIATFLHAGGYLLWHFASREVYPGALAFCTLALFLFWLWTSSRLVVRHILVPWRRVALATLLCGAFILVYSLFFRSGNDQVLWGELVFLIFAMLVYSLLLNLIDSVFYRSPRSSLQAALQGFCREIHDLRDMGELKERIIFALESCFNAVTVYLLMPDPKGDLLVLGHDGCTPPVLRFSRSGTVAAKLQALESTARAEEVESALKEAAPLEAWRSLHAAGVSPLKSGGIFHGALVLGPNGQRRPYSDREWILFEAVSLQVAAALGNLRRSGPGSVDGQLNRELLVARQIQRMLLPGEIPSSSSYEISALNIPSSQVGGDYHDFFLLREHTLGMAIADIAGKGIPGCILMSNLQASLRAFAPYTHDAGEVVGEVNRQLVRSTAPEKYATFLYAIYQSRSRRLFFCNAGHNYPLWRKADGNCEILIGSNAVIGVDEGIAYSQRELRLSAGDCLVLYTDGITEALNLQSEEFGMERLVRTVSRWSGGTAETLRDIIYDEVEVFTRGMVQQDDITLIVLRVL